MFLALLFSQLAKKLQFTLGGGGIHRGLIWDSVHCGKQIAYLFELRHPPNRVSPLFLEINKKRFATLHLLTVCVTEISENNIVRSLFHHVSPLHERSWSFNFFLKRGIHSKLGFDTGCLNLNKYGVSIWLKEGVNDEKKYTWNNSHNGCRLC